MVQWASLPSLGPSLLQSLQDKDGRGQERGWGIVGTCVPFPTSQEGTHKWTRLPMLVPPEPKGLSAGGAPDRAQEMEAGFPWVSSSSPS